MKQKQDLKTCSMCTRDKSAKTQFYSSLSPLHKSDGRIPYCKDCLKTMVDTDDINSIHATLSACDKPFLADIWKKATMLKKDTFGEYMRMVCSLHQFKSLTYKNSDSKDKINKVLTGKRSEDEEINDVKEEKSTLKTSGFEITEELRSKWGDYTKREINEMEKLYREMMNSNVIETPQHERQLYFYCKLSVLMDKALMEGDYSGYEKLSRQFTELQKSSGFRPIDRKSSDEANGIKSFSQIFAEVEANGYVEPLNVDDIENQDIVDKTILYILNYTRKVLGMQILKESPKDTPKLESADTNDST